MDFKAFLVYLQNHFINGTKIEFKQQKLKNNNMKKLLLLFALSLSIMVSAQDKLTEGIIVSKQTMSSDNEQMQAQFATMGDMLTTTYFTKNKSRTEVSSPMMGDIITISNSDTKESLMLMDNPMLGKTYAIQKNELTDEQLNSINIVAGNETKTILGYECKQYTVTIEQEGVKMDVELYTTEAIDAMSQQADMLGGKLKGFPLYMTMKMNQMGSNMTIITEVTEIKKESVSDTKFSMTPPEGYKKMEGQ